MKGQPIAESDLSSANYEEGIRLYELGNIDEAIKSLETAVDNKPDAPAMLYNLGIMYIRKENYVKVSHAFQIWGLPQCDQRV